MCGIAGIAGIKADKGGEIIKVMCDAIAHRGPDAEGFFTEDGISLGHRRLSIIDLSHAADQPFTDTNERYVIVFNGEIYNYQEVKKELNYPWKTSSDTEVILAAYIQWGKECLGKLNGMFAFAIWDKEKKSLFMARDRVGIKPFYYTINDGKFIFSSEIRSILKTGLIEKKIDRVRLCEYLERMSVRTPATIIKNLMQLEPGYCATFCEGEFIKEPFWQIIKPLDKDAVPESFESAKNTVFSLLDKSIQSRMVADVKVGAFLSGGIDSSAVVALMSKHSETPVQTYSIIFDEKAYDESEYARMIAVKYGTNHTEIKLKPETLLEEIPGFFSDLDAPTVDGINTYLVSKLVKQTGIKVVLTGLGGDELFAGYPNFIRWRDYSRFKPVIDNFFSRTLIRLVRKVYNNRAISKIYNLQNSAGSGFEDFYSKSRSIFLKSELDQILECGEEKNEKRFTDLNSDTLAQYPLLSRYSVAEITNYTLDVLIKDTDQMSMAWALEIREPFFDYRLIEYMLGVPDKFKYNKGTPKNLLVKAMGDLLPPEIVYRPKKGFSFPWDYWLRNELKGFCEDAIVKLSKRGLFNTENLMNFWKRFLNNDKSITWSHVWTFVVLEKWMDKNEIDI